MIEFIEKYVWQIIIGILIILFIAILINYRKALLKKIKQETISFIAMVLSISIALISFFSKPKVITTGTLALIEGEKISLAFPLTIFFIVLAIVMIIIFFRKELMKKI